MPLPTRVDVIEVGLRDGLQSEAAFVSTEDKVALLNRLIDAGVRHIEATSFVSPRAVPQMRDAAEVLAGARRVPGLVLSVLAPNAKGAERAMQAGADEIVVFVSASESHNAKNLNRSIDRSLQDIDEIAALTRGQSLRRKGAVATAFGCPFEGDVPEANIDKIVARYVEHGFDGITLGDTTGMATPVLVTQTVTRLQQEFPGLSISLHFHNTRGIGLVNVMTGLQLGITTYESSLGGMGGCPFAPGATGNICTEDLVNLLDEMDIATGIDLASLVGAARSLESIIGRPLPGQVMRAGPRLALHSLESIGAAHG
ncbi:hydroxymethylglutaryl-CoA lyase [Orrella dioscoreae]|uniref:Hydroxymethylglutaryl-CoA lyase n=1 Tax=Orrella dioscoreae TaxID=1851544 RepID=A0A1C3JXY8_9BURK|nr:hydroxymethylglutaryl-CoA lyase [Orrella dioscoreae]SBT24014.1 Hydroxymethylglutaryl-CoA lyase [Orrella dioscoreae]SOE51705.1 Hydroxymethylglutaryl-CoA lyase [Orrella dioscoreae]